MIKPQDRSLFQGRWIASVVTPASGPPHRNKRAVQSLIANGVLYDETATAVVGWWPVMLMMKMGILMTCAEHTINNSEHRRAARENGATFARVFVEGAVRTPDDV